MPKRSYSDEEKANALLVLEAHAGNVSGAARECGIPRVTLLQWRDGQGTVPAVSEIRQGKRLPLADQLEEVVRLIVAALPAEIDGANLRDAALAGAILTDKMRLLREQPTAISEHTFHSDAERADRILELLGAGGESGTRPAPQPPAVH